MFNLIHSVKFSPTALTNDDIAHTPNVDGRERKKDERDITHTRD